MKKSRFPRRVILHDLFHDVSIELKSQPAKTGLLIFAVMLSIGALLTSVGIAKNAAHQIDADLAASTIRLITVQATESTVAHFNDSSETEDRFFPANTAANLESLDGVEAAGLILDVSTATRTQVTRTSAGIVSPEQAGQAQSVTALTSGALRARDIDLTVGDPTLLDTSMPVAYLPSDTAHILGIAPAALTTGISIEVNGDSYSVAGFLPTGTLYGGAVIIPFDRGVELTSSDATATVLIKTKLGAGHQVAGVAKVAVLPHAPEKLAVSQVLSADSARDSVSVQMAQQASWVAIILIALATLLIANSMIVAVTARTTEIGLRRALGSSRLSVSATFLWEGGLIGLLGGATGSAFATWGITIVAWVSGWTAKIDPLWIALGPALGTAVGLLASAYPAFRASRIHPAIAVRAN